MALSCRSATWRALRNHDADIDGDAYFPALDASQWQALSRDSHVRDSDGLGYHFVHLRRRPAG